MNNRFLRQATFYLLIFMIAVALIQAFSKPPEVVRDINYYPQFIEHIEKGEIEEVTLVGNQVEATLKDGSKVKTYKPADDDLSARLIEHKIAFNQQPEPEPPWWSTLLTYLIPFILIIGLFFFFMQQTQGGGSRVMNFGKSR
ncbi:MAG: cell division protein FtsH, partial [Firmicutes bacterium]|nr:cell division protein FtsH [Bacillota bacterium]